jgi:hypothetical protein
MRVAFTNAEPDFFQKLSKSNVLKTAMWKRVFYRCLIRKGGTPAGPENMNKIKPKLATTKKTHAGHWQANKQTTSQGTPCDCLLARVLARGKHRSKQANKQATTQGTPCDCLLGWCAIEPLASPKVHFCFTRK